MSDFPSTVKKLNEKPFFRVYVIAAVCSFVLGFLLMAVLSGNSTYDLYTIAVSPDEEYIAYVPLDNRIRCINADGSLAFSPEVSLKITGGGTCDLWFEEDTLCVIFFRTDRVLRYAMDGTLLQISDNSSNEYQSAAYYVRKREIRYEGSTIDVVFDRCSIWEYWIGGKARNLQIIPKDGERIVVWSATAKDGVQISPELSGVSTN